MKTASLNLRVHPELKKALQQRAKSEGRSLANLIDRLLAYAILTEKKIEQPKLKRGRNVA